MAHLVEIAFKGNRKEFFLWDGPEPPPIKAPVIVEADRGEDLGHVHSVGEAANQRNAKVAHGLGGATPTQKARRLATESEVRQLNTARTDDEDARKKTIERVRANALVMKVTDAEWQWDRKKLTLYFTAEKRVDFRTLVRELASMFRTRIELKQIGVRDEAKRLDGYGRCGRQYCSAAWLPELRPVNLGVAKDQKLSLNPSQISGACGRLMCCLRYEHEFYVQSRKRFPKEGKIVASSLGEEKVLSVDIFRERITMRGVEGDVRILTLADYKQETEQLAEAGVAAVTANGDDEEVSSESIRPEEISPELLYTAEHPVFVPPNGNGPSSRPASSDVVPGTDGREGGSAGKRRRGRRGGRRGRGSDEPNSTGGQ